MNPAAPSPSDSSIVQAFREIIATATPNEWVESVGITYIIKRAAEIDASAPAAAVGGVEDSPIVSVDLWEAYKAWPEDLRKKLSMHDLRRMSGWKPPLGNAFRDGVAEQWLNSKATPAAQPSPHTTEDDYQHFLAYSGLEHSPLLQYAYYHGADVGMDKPKDAAQPSAKDGAMVDDGLHVFQCPRCPVGVESKWLPPNCPECGGSTDLDPTGVPQSKAEATTGAGLVDEIIMLPAKWRTTADIEMTFDSAEHKERAYALRKAADELQAAIGREVTK